jgi:hypothetical protein
MARRTQESSECILQINTAVPVHDKHDCRLEVASHLDCLGAIARLTHNRDANLIFDDQSKSSPNQSVVIDE